MESPLHFTPEGLLDWLTGQGIAARLHQPGVPMPTVPLAAEAIGVDQEQILKTLLFQDRHDRLVRVIAAGTTRINSSRLAAVAGLEKPVLAKPEQVLAATGWPAGGVAPVGSRLPLPTWIDQRVLRWSRVYGGGGTAETLIELDPADIVRLTTAAVVDLIGTAADLA